MTSALSLRNLSRRFGSVKAVDSIDLDMPKGEFVCLLGPSGCGKSTALRMIAGFETPDDGDILIGGQPVTGLPPNRRDTSMVFQSHALWSHMTIARNVAFGLKLRGLPRSVIAQKVSGAFALVGLSGLDKRYPRQLSGGQQQRVALARSLVLEPSVLLLDEPFASLDAHLRQHLREELKSIQRRLGLTTLFVTHDQEEAMTLADRIVVMNKGRIEQAGTPGDIYETPATLFTASFIGQMNIRPAVMELGLLISGPVTARLTQPRAAKSWSLAFRPEDCMLTNPLNAAVTGGVTDIADLGAHCMVSIALADGTRIKAQTGRRDSPERGAAVGVAIHRILAFADGHERVEALPHSEDIPRMARQA